MTPEIFTLNLRKEIKMATMTIPAQTTNAVQFGNFAIVLSKSQLEYYANGQLHKVRDVQPDFSNYDLYDLAVRISSAKNYGAVKFVNKWDVVKKF